MSFSGRIAILLAVTALGMLVSPRAWALEGDLLWAHGAGSTGIDMAYGITTDAAGNVYTTGWFSGTVDFDPGAGTVSLSATGSNDIFVCKYGPQGNLIWARGMLGAAFFFNAGYGIAVDGAGNVYTAGGFSNTVDFDPGMDSAPLTAAAGEDAFLLKLDANGDFVWAVNLGGNNTESARGLALDSAGNPVLAGRFQGTTDFDPSAGTSTIMSSGNYDVFVCKLDGNGALLWARKLGGTGADEGRGIALDGADNVYTCGSFIGTADFDPSGATANLVSAGGSDAFVSKLDANGDYVWAKQVGTTTNELAFGIAVSSPGNVYVTGSFIGTVDFDPDGGTENRASNGNTDSFVLSLNSTGAFSWVSTAGASAADVGNAVTLDGDGNVLATGAFSGSPDFDPSGGTSTLTSAGSSDAYVWKLASNGSLLLSKGQGGSVADEGLAIAADAGGNILTAGRFNGTADFDPGVGTLSLVSGGSDDLFVSKIAGADVFPPNAVTVTALPAGPTNATSVDFTVTFDEVVTGFDDASDLSVTHAGTSAAAASIAGGPVVYTVTISGIAGDGTVSLAANTGSDVTDLSENPLSVSATGAVTIDNTPPVVDILSPSGGPISSSSGTASFPILTGLTQTVSLDAADVSLNYFGTAAGGTVNVIGGNTLTPTVEISGVTGNGSVQISIAAGVSVDAAGNASLAAGPSSSAVSVDNTGPSVSSVTATPATASAGDVVSLSFLLNEFTAGDPDVTVNGNPATRTAKGAPLYTYEYTVLPGDPLGAATITISGVDNAGNAGLSTNTSALTITEPAPGMPLAAWPAALALAAIGRLTLRRRK